MRSEEFLALTARVRTLKRRYLPKEKKSGLYTPAEEDHMRALRLLFHAEVEAYLESICSKVISDLESELANRRRGSDVQRSWAQRVAKNAKQRVADNNGVKEKDILEMFGQLGLTEKELDMINPMFRDRMNTFGKFRGDVAHNSALKAAYSFNSAREGRFVDEIMSYLEAFDRVVNGRRVGSFL